MVKASSTQRSKQVSPRRQRLLFTLLTFSSLTSGAALAAGTPLPTGGQFAAGAGAITATANGLAISQSSTHGIINWQSFSIAAGKSVNIANGAGATLNRVTGGDLSSIAGSLTATGSVYVVNPSGVVVLPGGKVTTGGSFVASTRNVSNSDFMNGGAMTLSGTSSGAVVNQGTITSANGDVILVGKSVSNSGSISAAKGTAALAAGDNVLLQASGDDAVLVNAGSGDVTNTGTIAAAQVALDAAGGNVYALATNDGGVIRATGTKTKDGHVYLTGGDGLEVDGAVSATNADGSGGTIMATAATVNIGATAKISANGTTKGGGTILIGGDRHGGSDPSVALSKTPIANAKTTTVAAGATISANAGKNGKGGNVVVWSDQSTSYSGSISAKGGTTAGDGGFVEVSGKQHLGFVGDVTTTAVHGANGTLLLDPADVTIVAGASGAPTGATQNGGNITPDSGSASSTITNGTIVAALASNDVVITTTNSGTSGSGLGNILVNAPINWDTGTPANHSLTLTAANTITFGAVTDSITTMGTGNITLTTAGDSGNSAIMTDQSLHFGIEIGAPISAAGGTINIKSTYGTAGQGQIIFSTSGAKITNTTGDIDLTTTSNITVNANITATSGGNINLVSTGTGNRVTIGNGVVVETYGAGSVLLQSDTVLLGSGAESNATGQVITDSTGKVTVQPASTGLVYVGDGNEPAILRDQDIALITTGTLVIGSNGMSVNGLPPGGVTTGLSIVDNLDSNASVTGNTGLNPGLTVTKIPLATVSNLALISNGYVTENAAATDGNYAITVGANGTGGLAVSAGTYIDLSGVGAALGFSNSNHVGTLAMKLTGAGTAPPVSDGSPSTASIQFGGDASSGSLTIGTVDGISGINANPSAGGSVGTVYLANAGTVVQDTSSAANAISATSLDLEGAGAAGSATPTTGVTGTYSLKNNANQISTVAGSVSALNLYDSMALSQTSTTTLTASGTGTGTTNAAVQIVDSSDITLASGSVISDAAGGDIQLETGTKFSAGDANTLQTTGADTTAAGGHWRVYSQSPLTTGESKGGLTYGYIQYATPNTPASPFGSTVQGTGNGFLYAYQPTVTATLTGATTKQYDGTATASAGLTYGTPTGVVAGDTVTLNTPTAGTYQTSSFVPTPNVSNATLVGVTGVTVATETSTNSASQVVPVYNYLANSTATGTGSITAAPLTIAGTKVYNGTTAFTFNQLSVTSAAVNGEVVTITAGTGASSSANARPATPYANSALSGLTISVMNGNALASNYSLPTTGNLTITPLPITVTGTRQYDGTTGAASTLLTVTDAVGSDVVGLSGTGQTTSPHASTTPYALTSTAGALTGLTVTNTNYTTTGGSGTFTITPLPVTLTGTRVYNGATGAAANLLTVTNAVGTDVVSVTGTGQVTSPNASTTAYALTSTGGALTGLTATNSDYTTTGGSGLFTITPLPITVTGTRTYNGTTGASSTLLTVTDAVGSDMVGLTGTGQVTSANASTTPYTLTSTGGALTGLAVTNTNYTTTGGSGTFTITPLPITVTGTRNYDGTTGASSTLLTVTDTVGTDTVGLSGTGQTTSPHASSTPYSLTSTGGALTGLTVTNTNYTTTGGTGTFTITPLPITVSGTRNYNGTTGASSTLLTVTDTVGTDTVGLSGTGQTTSPNASTTPYALTSTAGALTGLTVSNTDYTTTGGSGTFTITPLPITVSGTRNYDGTTGASSTLLTVTDTVGTDTVGLSGTGQTTSPHASTTPYTLTSTGGALTGLAVTNTNYTTTGGSGTFTITPLPITVTGTRNYDGTTGASSTLLTVTDTVGTDTVGLSGTGQTTSPHASSTPYSLTSTGGALTGLAVSNTDYTTTGGTGTFTITPLPITVSGTRNYNGTTGASSTLLTVTDTVGTDTVGLSGTGQTTSPNASTTPYALTSTGGALTGLTVSNTDYTTIGGSGTFTITPLPITVSGTRNYDGTTGASSTLLTVTDTVGTDTVGLSGTGQTTSPNASTTPYALTSTGGALTGLTVTNTNYTTTGGSGTFTITPLPVVLTGMRAYNGTTGAASNLLTVTNVVGTDTVGLSGTGAVSSPNASTTPYALLSTSGALTGLAVSNANYTTTGGSGTFTITAAMLTATANGSKLYDGMATAPAADITLSGLMNGDTQGNQVSITGTGVLSSAHANSYTSTGTNSFTLGTLMLTGTDANNYNLALGTFTVSPLPITVTGTRNYNGTTGASSTLLTVTDAVGSDVVGLSGTGQTTSPNASTTPYALTSTGGALTGLAVSNTDYTTTGGTGTFTITPLPITVSGTRNYDGTTGAVSSILTVTDTVGTDTVGLGGTGQVTSPHASGTPYALTSTGGSLTGLTVTNTNYTTTGGSGTLSITALPITVTGTRTYNGTTGASSTLLTVTDTVGTDTVGLSGTGQTTSPNASTTPYALTSTGGALTGLTVSNTDYTTTGGTGTFTITPLPITVSGTRNYDGTTGAVSAILTVTDTVGTDTVGLGGTGQVTSPHASGTPYALTSTGGSLTGLTVTNTNYTTTGGSGTLSITPLPITVTGTRTYNGTTGASSTLLTVTDTVGTDTVGLSGTGQTTSPNASTTPYALTSTAGALTGLTVSNTDYTTTGGSGTFTITPLAVTLTGTRTYDGMTDAAGTILSATNDLDGANLTIGGTGVLASKNVGNEALTSTGGSLTGLTLGGSAATNYTLASATGSVNVTKAGLVISAVTDTKVYNASTSSTGTPTVVGLQTGDSVSGSPLTQAFNSANVAGTNGSTLSVTNFTGVNDGNGGGNYTVTVNTAMGTITPLAVTLTGTRTYDGMTDAAGTILSATNDLDGANLTIGGTGVLAGKNVGNEALTSTGGSLTGLTLGGSAATNYTLASATGSVNVTKAGLVISAVTQTKTYDATTTSTGTPTVVGLQTGDSVSGSPLTQAFNSPNVAGTNGSTLSVTNFTGVNDGNGGGNYTVTVNTAMGTITPLAVTLTGTRTYDGMTDAAGTILSATNDLDGANLTIGGTGVLAGKNVGNEALTSTGGSLTGLTLGGSAATNYTLASATGSVNVTKAGLVISAVTQTKTYDATTSSTGTPTITGLQTGDSVSGSPLTQAFNSPNVAGTNGSTLSVTNFTGVNDGNGGGNYTVTVNTAMGTITPLAVTLTGTRTYDGMTDAAGTILSATNDLDGANLTIGGTGVLAGKNVGNEALTSTGGSLTGLTLGGSAATNYTLASATGSVNVTKAGLVISAVTDTKVYNASTSSTGTPTITGLQTGDSVSGSPLTQAFNSANVAGTNGSTLSVTNFTGVNDGNGGGNYTVTVNTAMGTITPLAVTLTGTRTYDGMTDAAGTILSATNDLDGANLTIGGTGVLAGKNVGNEALTSTGGSLTGLTLGGSAATNYTLASATGSVNVTKAGLVISAVTDTKAYDATTTSTGTPTITGLQTGDSVSGSPLTQAFNSPNVAGTNGSILSVTNFTGVNDGNGGGNYTVTVNTAMGTITPLAVTLTGTRTYDGMTDAAGTILSATNDLDGANLTIGGTGVLASKNVGNEALTSTGGSLTGLTLGGSAATNYTLASATGSVNVTKAGLVISAVTDTKVYDGGVSSVGTPTITGLQTGDSVSGSPLTQIFGSKNVLGTNGSTLSVNNFTGVNDGNGGANYNVTVNTAMGTITPLAVNETGTRVYNGTPGVDGSIITIANAIPGDTVSVTGTGTLGGKDTGTQTITNPGTLTLTGGDAGNYTTTGGSSAITITPFAVTLAGTRVYDGNTDGNAPILGVTNAFAGDTVTVASGTSTIASKNVGPEAITNFGTLALGGASAGDYTLTGATGTVTVTPLAVTLAGTRVYDGLTDGNAPILSVTNAIAGDSPTVASGTSTIASKNVGPEGITSVGTLALGNNPNGNYTLVGATGVVTVTPLSVVATGTRVYDGTPGVNGPILTITDKIPGDTVSIIGTGTLTGKDKGPQTVSTIGTLALTGGDAGNYVFNPAAATVTITPFAVNLAGTRTYDGLTDGNSNILSVTNAFAGDTVNVASGTSTIANKNVGTEGITNFGTLALGNNMAGDYTLVGATGAVKVTPLALTVTAVNTPKVYDGTTGSSGTPVITVGALQGTDTGAFIQQFGTKNAGTGLTLTPSGVVTDGNGGNNYIVTFAPITTGVISPRPVVLNGTRPFDNTPGALASILNITNLVSGDSVTLGGVATLASGSPGIEPINNFSGLTLAGGPAADYTFVGATGTVLVTPVIMPTIAEILTVPSTQTSSGTGETVTFSAFSGGILTLTPKQNGVVTGTIATIDGNDYQPDAQLSCTLGQDGCVQNGVAVTPPK